MRPKPVLLDTDLGTDVDDCLALALILRSPELALVAVTTVYGDVLVRARMALKLLALAGTGGVPVASGAAEPLPGAPAVYWAGHEGEGLLDGEDAARFPIAAHAADLIVRTAAAQPGELTVVAIGPLTNLALALRREPALPRMLAGVVVMGGVIGTADRALPLVEHNFGADPAAAAEILTWGAGLTVVPLDVTTQVRLEPEDVMRIRAVGDPLATAVAGQVERYPRYRRQRWTYLHDPLAAAALIKPDLVAYQSVHALVERGGRLLAQRPTAYAPATAQIALEVDAARARQFIVERLSQAQRTSEA